MATAMYVVRVFIPVEDILLQGRPAQHHLTRHLDHPANSPGHNRRKCLLDPSPDVAVRGVQPHLAPDLEGGEVEEAEHGPPRGPHASQEHGHQQDRQHVQLQVVVRERRQRGGDHGGVCRISEVNYHRNG